MQCPKVTRKRFLTVFPFFESVHLHKDVGAIPYFLSQECGWQSSVAYFAATPGVSEIRDEDYGKQVTLLCLGQRSSRLINFLNIAYFFLRRAQHFDVLNLYHDSVIHMIYAVLFKIRNPSGLTYFKLDMNHLELERISRSQQGGVPSLVRRLKYLLSKVAVTLYTVENTSAYHGLVDDYYFKSRLHYLPNGFRCPPAQNILKTIAVKENVILTVGRLGTHQKFTELLIEAVASLDSALVYDWKVYLVGPVLDAEGLKASDTLHSFVEEVVGRKPHLKDTFVFLGNIESKEQLYDIFRKAKIFCLTSRYESFGLVLLEAMYFGDYVISSDLPASRDITGNGTVGVTFPIGEVQALAGRLEAAMSGKIDLFDVGQRSHETVRYKFDWKNIARELDFLLAQ